MASYTAEALLKKQQKQYGKTIGGFGAGSEVYLRCSTGSLDHDIAIGGGFPINKMMLLYGNEGCGKTTKALLCIAEFQKRWPHKVCVYVETDGGYKKDWARQLGVDVEKLITCYPDYIHEAIDIVESYLLAEDVGLVVFDSLAATMTIQEASETAEKELPGISARMGNKLCRKILLALRQAEKTNILLEEEDKEPDQLQTFILINQIRSKLGVMYGSPDTLPGGKHQLFVSSLTTRIYSKPKMDSKENKLMPVFRVMSITVDKWRQPITRRVAKYDMAIEQVGDIAPGRCNDWKTAKKYLTEFGWMVKTKKGWSFFGEEHATQAAGWESLRTTPGSLDEFRSLVVKTIKQTSQIPDSSEEPDAS